jgi:c-di-GMP-binding flagellar brake protein YcgR
MLLANRRGSDRLRPPAAQPACVRILDVAHEASSEAIVHDISTTGISILVEPEVEKHLSERVQLRLSIHLPDSGKVEASATIRHRRLFGSAVLYGLEFDGQIPGFMGAQERLLSYLTSLRSKRN